MGLLAKLFKNVSYLTIGSQAGNLLQFLLFLLFARQFGKEILGKYSFSFSFTYVFFILADFGLSTYMMREVARDRSGNRQILAQCLILRLFSLTFLTMIASVIVLFFFKEFSQETINIIFFLGLYHIFLSIADIFLAEFKAHDRMGIVALLNIFVRFIISSAGILLIMLNFKYLTVLACFPLGAFIYLIMCGYLSHYYFWKIQPQFRSLNLKGLFVQILPFAFALIFAEAFYHLDILMLRILKDDQSVGIYSAANNIVLGFLGAVLFIHIALLPTLSRFYIESKSKLIDVSKRSLRYLILLGLPISTGIFAISDKLIVLLYSETFKDSVIVVDILCWTIAFGFAAAIYSILLTAINRQTEKVIALGICLAFNFVVNLILIPKLSYNGAATAKLMTEALHFMVMAYLVSKHLSSISVHKIFIKPALCCIFMYVFIRLFHQWNLIFLVLVSALVYLISLGAMRVYLKEEVEVIKRIYLKIVLPGAANS